MNGRRKMIIAFSESFSTPFAGEFDTIMSRDLHTSISASNRRNMRSGTEKISSLAEEIWQI